jgi:hypothetical protein
MTTERYRTNRISRVFVTHGQDGHERDVIVIKNFGHADV